MDLLNSNILRNWVKLGKFSRKKNGKSISKLIIFVALTCRDLFYNAVPFPFDVELLYSLF